MAVPTILLGLFILSLIHGLWATAWLVHDPNQTKALVVEKLSHGVVGYRYSVNNQEYSGQGQPNRPLRIGDEAMVNFSRTHPWLSALKDPGFSVGSIPMFVIPLLIEILLVMTIINPKGRWALKTGIR